MEFIETPKFTELLQRFGIKDELLRELQIELTIKPDKGNIYPGTGGIRKIRMKKIGGGKSGGYRVLYYWKLATDFIYMIFVFPKKVQADLTSNQKQVLKAIVKDI